MMIVLTVARHSSPAFRRACGIDRRAVRVVRRRGAVDLELGEALTSLAGKRAAGCGEWRPVVGERERARPDRESAEGERAPRLRKVGPGAGLYGKAPGLEDRQIRAAGVGRLKEPREVVERVPMPVGRRADHSTGIWREEVEQEEKRLSKR